MKFFYTILCLLIYTAFKGQNGPGGVSNTSGTGNLVLWLKANNLSLSNGATVSNWTDQSGYNNNAAPVANAPTFTTNFYNGQPVVSFNAASTQYLVVPDAASLKPDNISLFVVGQMSSVSGGWSPYILKTSSFSWGDGYGITRSGSSSNIWSYVSAWNQFYGTGTLGYSTPAIMNLVYDNVNVAYYQNNTFIEQRPYTANIVHTTDPLNIGISSNGGASVTSPLDGNIAEIIIINRNVNAAERIIISNYLSAKYNVPIGANDVYNEDDAANGNYDNDVAGIGRVDMDNEHLSAKGDIVAIKSPSGLDDNEFLMWGHDNQPITPLLTTDLPVGVVSRLGRTWRASEAGGDVGLINIEFDLAGFTMINPLDLRLLIDTDNDGSFADEIPIAGALPQGGNIFRFPENGNLDDNMRFTLGTANIISLPLKLNSFGAQWQANNQVKLFWNYNFSTAINRFEIERSIDGFNWQTIQTLAALTTNGSNTISQNAIDVNAIIGTTYYRLKMIENNGSFIYSGIKKLSLNAGNNLVIYPNPAKQKIFIENLPATNSLVIVNSSGQSVMQQIIVSQGTGSIVEVAIEKLPTGIYFVKTSDGKGFTSFIKQ
jgi:hypothetical protein